MVADAGTFWIPSLDDLARLSPELILAATILVVLIAPLFARRSSNLTAGLALLGVVGMAVASFRLFGRVEHAGQSFLAPSPGSAMLVIDNFSLFFKLFLCVFLAGIILLWWVGSARQEERVAPEFFALLLGSALGMALMVSTLNLLMLLVAVETASLPSYCLAGFDKNSRRSGEAALKYVIFGAVSAAVMLYGISLIYGYYGTLSIPELARRVVMGVGGDVNYAGGNFVLGLGLLGIVVGLGFKLSVVPFHFWCPDVFEGAKIEVTTWLSVASKAAALALMLRIIFALANPADVLPAAVPHYFRTAVQPLAYTVGILACITCTVGNLAAYRQQNLKRMLAYSSIAHAGYMLMAGAIVTAPRENIAEGVSAAVAYLIVYLFMNLGAFGTVALVAWRTGSETLSEYVGMGRRSPWLAVMMAIFMFSLIGVPPLGGFIVKFFLLKVLWDVGSAHAQPWLYLLVIVAVVNTLLSLYYYLRVVWYMYLLDDGRPAIEAPPIGGMAILGVCTVVILLTGVPAVQWLWGASEGFASYLYLPAAASP